MPLYPDQEEVYQDLRQAMRTHKSVLLQSATGSGKTRIATHMLHNVIRNEKKAVFCVPRRDLFKQTSETFKEEGIKHGMIAAGRDMDIFARIHLGMIDTMSRRIDRRELPRVDVVVVDEAHFGETALDRVINYYKDQGAWIIGLSATPWKLSGKGLGCWYDSMVQGKSMKWLIANKRLSDYRLFSGQVKPDFSAIKVTAGDYNQKQLGEYFDTEHGSAIIGDAVRGYVDNAHGKRHIVRCVSIAESQKTAAKFCQAGIPAAHLDGTTPDDEKMRILVAFAKREIWAITFCQLLTFGFDLSQYTGMDVCVESGSDLKPSKSLSDQMQWWGRMFRYKPFPAVLNDHVNNWREHGLPDDDRDWTLADREKQGRGTSVAATPIRQCPECWFVHKPAEQCPSCGFKYTGDTRKVDHVPGQLLEVKKGTKATPLNEKEIKRMRAQLTYVAQKRKYRNPKAWAKRMIAQEIMRRSSTAKE